MTFLIQGEKEVIRGLKVNSVGKTIKHLESFLKIECVKKLFLLWI